MKNDYILLNVFKDKGLLKGLIISLLTHFLLFNLFPIKKDKLFVLKDYQKNYKKFVLKDNFN